MFASTPITIDTPLEIDTKLAEDYQQNGHVRVNQVCPEADLLRYREIINDVVTQRKKVLELKPLEERDTYGKAFLQLMNLWPDSEAVARFVTAKRFASVAAQLMGVKKVRIYHDQALYKEPYSGFTPMHQDQHYWPVETDNCITMWLPLMGVSKEMGTLNFASGTGRAGYLGDMPISDDSEELLAQMCSEKGYEIVNYGAMDAGDATFHSGWCLHGAPANTTGTMREVMTVIWVADGTQIISDPDPQERWNQSRWDDMERWLPDRKPGEFVDGRLNPLISPFE